MLFMNSTLRSQTVPAGQDFLLAASGMGVALGLELFAKEYLLPETPRFSEPNSFDRQMRDLLYLGPERQTAAARWSDGLAYGISLSSLVWGPLLAEAHQRAALINMEVFAVNSVLTNMTKIAVARERPYHHYSTAAARGPVDYASFYSGHSSLAFSQAVANAMILTQQYPDSKRLIWVSLLGSAGATAYLRVAGDMHYFSDIIMGAAVGSLIAWSITHHELERFDDDPLSDLELMFSLKIPLG